jgi:hypothetical protein
MKDRYLAIDGTIFDEMVETIWDFASFWYKFTFASAS